MGLIEEPNRLHEPITTNPTSAVADFSFLPPTPGQRASNHTTLMGNSTLESPWIPDLGSLDSMAPIEVTADRWTTTSSLVVPSMDPLAMLAWNEAREVKVSQPEASYN